MSSVESGGSPLDRVASLDTLRALSEQAVDCLQELAQLQNKKAAGIESQLPFCCTMIAMRN